MTKPEKLFFVTKNPKGKEEVSDVNVVACFEKELKAKSFCDEEGKKHPESEFNIVTETNPSVHDIEMAKTIMR